MVGPRIPPESTQNLCQTEQLEWSLISYQNIAHSSVDSLQAKKEENQNELVESLIRGDLEDVLCSTPAREIFGRDVEDLEELVWLTERRDFSGFFSRRIASYLHSTQDTDSKTQLLNVLCIGVACLNAYIQCNYTGPLLNIDPMEDLLSPAIHDIYKNELRTLALEALAEDNEEAYHLCEHPEMLYFAKCILIDNQELLHGIKTLPIHQLHLTLLHQRLLSNPSATLKSRLLQLVASLPPAPTPDIRARLHMTTGLTHHYYRQDKRSKASFELAKQESGLKYQLSGALGKRTKFQENAVAQMVVLAKSLINVDGDTKGQVDTPQTLALNDDTLLETISYESNPIIGDSDSNTLQDPELAQLDPNNQPPLWPGDQALLLSLCLNIKNTNPVHGLTKDEMQPFVNRVLAHPLNWIIHSLALLLRSRLESDRTRTVERAVLQIQALIDQFSSEDTKNPSIKSAFGERISFFHVVEYPSKWELEQEAANKWMSIGMIKTAQDIFERLEMWEDVAHCYVFMEQPKKAEDIIRQQLDQHPHDPKLLCLLGELTQNPELLKQSWSANPKRKYSRAMRSLGAYHFKRHEYAECIDAYTNALQINPLFENAWFVLGCAAMRTEQFEIAIDAFTRCTHLDDGNAEAWNNLASVYISSERPVDAYRALTHSLKHCFDNHRIWANYLYVSFSIGEYTESIRAMERIFELQVHKVATKEESVDWEILGMLVDIASGRQIDGVDESEQTKLELQSKIVKPLKSFLDTLNQNITSSKLLRLTGSFYTASPKPHTYKNVSLALEFLEREFRLVLNQPTLCEEEERVKELLNVLERLIAFYRDHEQELGIEKKEWVFKCRMACRGVIGRIKDTYDSTPLFDRVKELQQELKEM